METPFFLLLLQMAQYNNVIKNSYPRGGETPSLHPIAAAPQAMTLGRGFSFSRSILGPTRPPSWASPSRKLQFLPAKDPPVLLSLLSSLFQKSQGLLLSWFMSVRGPSVLSFVSPSASIAFSFPFFSPQSAFYSLSLDGPPVGLPLDIFLL